jgi:hypothetical protein
MPLLRFIFQSPLLRLRLRYPLPLPNAHTTHTVIRLDGEVIPLQIPHTCPSPSEFRKLRSYLDINQPSPTHRPYTFGALLFLPPLDKTKTISSGGAKKRVEGSEVVGPGAVVLVGGGIPSDSN